jgi:hypothetical protein
VYKASRISLSIRIFHLAKNKTDFYEISYARFTLKFVELFDSDMCTANIALETALLCVRSNENAFLITQETVQQVYKLYLKYFSV